ncbi:hypothetical protein SNK03_011324 [Fusarium graminearum]
MVICRHLLDCADIRGFRGTIALPQLVTPFVVYGLCHGLTGRYKELHTWDV